VAFDKGGYQLAIEGYRKALAARPDFTDARYNLAVAHLARGEAAKALPQLERVIAEQPKHAPALGNAGVAASMLDDHRGAIAYLRRALEIDPELDYAQENLKRLLASKRPPGKKGSRR
jgi:tetratricopeptide (TPR) repeat protein